MGHCLPFFLSGLVCLSDELNETGYVYRIYESRINDLLYMGNLKLYGENDEELEGLLSMVKISSNDIDK